MASKPVFTILCAFGMVVGFLTFIFGLIDRIGIQMQISFLMLPIWNGVLFGCAGFAGVIIGRQNRTQGYIGSGMTSGLKAINMLCFGLSLLTFYMYGSIVMYIGFRIEYNDELFYNYPTSATLLPKLLSTNDGTPVDDTRQGIFAMIILFSLVEMFIGAWIIMLEKEKMVLGSSSSSDQVPLVTNEPYQYIQQPQYGQPNAGMVVSSPQVRQQQQPVYMVAPGGNAPLPARAVVAPISQQQHQQHQQHQQQQQQPTFVVLQPSAVMATNQPQVVQQPQPQYVVMQNQVPNAPQAQIVAQEHFLEPSCLSIHQDPTDIQYLPQQDQPDVRRDTPSPQAGENPLVAPQSTACLPSSQLQKVT